LLQELNQLRQQAGSPSLVNLATHAALAGKAVSKSTFGNLLNGKDTRLATVEAFVLACARYASTRRPPISLPPDEINLDVWGDRYAAAHPRPVPVHGSHGGKDGSVGLAEAALKDGLGRYYDGDFEAAASCYEAAVELAIKARDAQLEARAHSRAARVLVEMLMQPQHHSDRERRTVRSRADEHLDHAERLGANDADLAVERALTSALGDDPAESLRLALRALEITRQEGHEKFRVNAVVACVQAYWRLGEPDKATALAADVAEALRTHSDDETQIVLNALWLRNKCKAGQATGSDVAEFCQLVRAAMDTRAREPELPAPRTALIVGEVADEFNRAGALPEVLTLRELICELAGSSSMACVGAVQVAELAAEIGDVTRAHSYLDRAAVSMEEARIRAVPGTTDDGPGWVTLRVLVLRARGCVLLRLAIRTTDPDEAVSRLRDGEAALDEAITFATEHHAAFEGNVDDFITDMRWWLARAKSDLNRPDEAAEQFHLVRTAPTMRYPGFVAEVGMRAWFYEAVSLLHNGQPEAAGKTISQLLADDRVSDDITRQAGPFARYVKNGVLPNRHWLDSPEAQAIATLVRSQGLRRTVAAQLAPLVSWWQEWQDDVGGGPQSELLDFWGRGGFARIAAAVRAAPHEAITVDARTLEEIRQWARILCPMFDTVIVKWKGELSSGMVMAPLREDYGGPESFGGHGYQVAAGLIIRDKWAPAMSWANPLPREVTTLLATEALPLMSSGRLVLLPAPLVGCTQSSVGWTDHLLLGGLLGGVVNVIADVDQPPTKTSQQVLDLTSHRLPYIADIGLRDLAAGLDETTAYAGPLRGLLEESLQSVALKEEEWISIRKMKRDFQDACQQLRSGLKRVSQVGGWPIAETTATVSAGSIGAPVPRLDAGEPVTDLLRAITSQQRELAPWIPYWRLHERGGHLDWSRPLDNPSKENPAPRPEFPSRVQSWLSPGTGGWTCPTVRSLEPA
jgi:hypothetical protein